MLLFICYRLCLAGLLCCVSIHHMLLFIGSRSENWILSARFNTSHVTLYRTSHLIQWIRYGRFNTSHVTLYRKAALFWFCWSAHVSIHHMLLFILQRQHRLKDGFMFQYITCYSLSEGGVEFVNKWTGFNTSHVTLYLSRWKTSTTIWKSFNTSHVTLYPNLMQFIHSFVKVSIHHMLLFIFWAWMNAEIIIGGFNTSHVTLYQKLKTEIAELELGFNTSHVTLYPNGINQRIWNIVFQYITCYSLSQTCLYYALHIKEFQYITCYSLSIFTKEKQYAKK